MLSVLLGWSGIVQMTLTLLMLVAASAPLALISTRRRR
jgi:hypothetical protein